MFQIGTRAVLMHLNSTMSQALLMILNLATRNYPNPYLAVNSMDSDQIWGD